MSRELVLPMEDEQSGDSAREVPARRGGGKAVSRQAGFGRRGRSEISPDVGEQEREGVSR